MAKGQKHNPFDDLPKAEIALAMGVTSRTITNWEKTGCPRKPNGRFDLAAVIHWRIQMMTPEPSEAEVCDNPALARFRTARAEMAEIDLELKRGEVIPRQEAEDFYIHRLQAFVEALGSLVNRMPPLLVDRTRDEIEALFKDEIDDLREGLIVSFYGRAALEEAKREGKSAIGARVSSFYANGRKPFSIKRTRKAQKARERKDKGGAVDGATE